MERAILHSDLNSFYASVEMMLNPSLRGMKGKTTYMIASQLTKDGIPTPAGKKRWQASTIESILTNEKYMGAALLQKQFTVDFLTKTKKKNEGEVPQYYVENSHPAIIDPLEFQLVQREIARRKLLGRKYSGSSVLSCRIICADCGEYFGAKVWHSTSKYRTVIWQCNGKFRKKESVQRRIIQRMKSKNDSFWHTTP